MTGIKNSQEKLNGTLLLIARLLNSNNITNWFAGYGTLLGIIREGSCINNDDDIDIICNRNDYDAIKSILGKRGFYFDYGHGIGQSRSILKTQSTKYHASVDFYMAAIDNEGNFHDTWEMVTWSGCYISNSGLIQRKFFDATVYLPNNYENKLVRRYGNDWRIPKNTKGPTPRKRIL